MDKLDQDEKSRISEMRREKREGGSGIGWMYRDEKPDSEEYLLGKRIDKYVEGETEQKEDEASVIFGERIKANIALDVAAKMREDPLFAIRRKEEESRKQLLENPVKMKELQRLIDQQQKQKESKDKKKKKKEKKRKKNKKSQKDSGSDSEDSGSEDDIMKKYLSILTSKHTKGGKDKKKKKQHSDASDEDERKQERRGRPKEQPHRERRGDSGSRDRRNDQRERSPLQRNRGRSPDHRKEQERSRERGGRQDRNDRSNHKSHRQLDSESAYDRSRGERKYEHRKSKRRSDSDGSPVRDQPLKGTSRKSNPSIGKDERKVKTSSRRSSSSSSASSSKSPSPPSKKHILEKKNETRRKSAKSQSSSSGEEDRSNARSHEDSTAHSQRRQYGLIMTEGSLEVQKSKKRSRSPNQSSKSFASLRKKPVQREPTPPRRKLTDEEKQRRLEEMMEDAKWREDQRSGNVKRYKEEDLAREKKDQETKGGAFLSTMMVDHASSSSVEDRLKRNKYNIQRTQAALDKRFTDK